MRSPRARLEALAMDTSIRRATGSRTGSWPRSPPSPLRALSCCRLRASAAGGSGRSARGPRVVGHRHDRRPADGGPCPGAGVRAAGHPRGRRADERGRSTVGALLGPNGCVVTRVAPDPRRRRRRCPARRRCRRSPTPRRSTREATPSPTETAEPTETPRATRTPRPTAGRRDARAERDAGGDRDQAAVAAPDGA